jgi:CheY-like chemotaxis protein
LLDVINDILDLSKLDAARVTLEIRDFSPRQLVDGVVALFAAKIQKSGLRVEAALDDAMPAWVKGDPDRIRQILVNLMSNALKFTKQGSIRIEASHRELPDASLELGFAVKDTGVGIPASAQSGLFEPFMQADTSISRKYGGTGLGLAICKRLCAAMGGTIGVESEPDRGTRFSFTVRCGMGSEPMVIEAPAEAPAEEARTSLNILVAEDHDINWRLISALLAKRGHKADWATNGREAIAAMRSKTYDLVLMDIQMPEMDGVAATIAIRQVPGRLGKTPIIALTADAVVGQREVYLSAGMNDYLTKPIRPNALYAAIDRWTKAPPGD